MIRSIPVAPAESRCSSTDLLDEIRDRVAQTALGTPPLPITISGLWRVGCNFRPSVSERLFVYNILVAQCGGQGACYYEDPEIPNSYLSALVGKPYRCEPTHSRIIDIALLDAVASSALPRPTAESTLDGAHSSKALRRASLIVDEISCLAKHIGRPNGNICMVGVVSLVIRELLSRGFGVTASDRDAQLVGSSLFGKVEVLSGRHSPQLIASSDIALVSGMALSTHSMAPLLECARTSGTQVVVYAETGANFAPYYLEHGAAIVVSEPFSFYTFDGRTTIRVFRSMS